MVGPDVLRWAIPLASPTAFTHFSRVKSQARNLLDKGITAAPVDSVDSAGTADAIAGLTTISDAAAASTIACVNLVMRSSCLAVGP